MSAAGIKYKILVTPTSMKPDAKSDAITALEKFASEIVYNTTGKPLGARMLLELLDGCDGVIAGLDDYNAEVIRAAGAISRTGGRLKVISRYGSGYDNVDLAAARENNVLVCYTPGANAQAVADLAFGLMLCAARRLPLLDRKTKAGEWTRSVGVELFGKTIGIIGLGAVGKAVAKRAQGFSMRILAYDPALDADYAHANHISAAALGELLGASDFISLHLPLNAQTKYIIDKDALRLVKPGAILINTARGGLIDEAEAYSALMSGRLGGLGLDAYETEPPDASSPLYGLDNVVLTPHTGSHTAEATAKLAGMAVNNLIDALSGRGCEYIL